MMEQIFALRWYLIIGLVRLCYLVRLGFFGEWIAMVTGLRSRLEAFLKGGAS